MSGIKCNENVTEVASINPATLTSFSPVETELEAPTVSIIYNTNKIINSPKKIREMLDLHEPYMKNKPLPIIKKQVINNIQKIAPMVKTKTIENAKEIAKEIKCISAATNNTELIKTYEKLTNLCIKEHTSVFQTNITATVKIVMTEVGFNKITIKQLGSTPIVIAKNVKGQTIRTEITETPTGEINLVRIQSGIKESECDLLNKKINLGFENHGLKFNAFVKLEKAREEQQYKPYDFSDNQENNLNQNVNQINLKL